jgi:RNA polymerase sigma-70 factor (ECF subfamily)
MVDAHRIYEDHAAAVHGFAVSLTGDPTLADDLTSEAFVRLWTAPGEIRLQTVRAYLCTIVRNLHVSHLRRARRSSELDESLPDPVDRVGASIERRAAAAAARRALAALPADDRAALLLRAADVPYADIASALGISVSAAKVRVHRARVRLLRLRDQEESSWK